MGSIEDEQLAQAIDASLAQHHSSQDVLISFQQKQSATAAAVAADEQQLALALNMSQKQKEDEDRNERMNAHALSRKMQRLEERNKGSWDCVHCTLTNRPYATKCSACNAKAPVHVLTFVAVPAIRFGVEIEIIVSEGKRDGFTVKTIAEDLTKLGPETVRYRGYSHETTNYWKIVTDSSLCGNDDDSDLCVELVSPVLLGEAGLNSIRSIMDNIRCLGIATNASCGYHVHVDAEEQSEVGTLEGLKRVAQCFVSLENAFDMLVARSWDNSSSATTMTTEGYGASRQANRNRYCQSNRLAFGQMSNKQRWQHISSALTKDQLVHMINPCEDRYRKLNFTNITKPNRPSTCEFRHHRGVEHLQEAEAWVRLILLFCQNAVQCTPQRLACLLPEGSSTKAELEALFGIVACQGLEQFFMVDRRLFLDRRLCNEWYCRVCHRKFSNSRSLSQHCLAVDH